MSFLFPIVTDTSKKYFVDEQIVKPVEVDFEGVKFHTAPLRMGVEFSLLGLSQNDDLIKRGTVDSTDTIDMSIILSKIYFEDGSFIETSVLPTAAFQFGTAGNYREVQLNFTGKDPAGNKIHLVGSLNLETSNCVIRAAPTEGSKPVGYTLLARRTNSNILRQPA